jgi:Uma2 family endonuclease
VGRHGPLIESAMVEVAERAATYEDLLAVPEHLVAEILFGRLVTHPRPAPRCSVAATALLGALCSPFQVRHSGSGGWIFLHKPEVHLGPHVVVPGLAAWRSQRLSALPSEAAWIDIVPDWVCDFLSPSTQRHYQRDKRMIYAKAGIRHLWHLDPVLKILEVFELMDDKWLLLDVFRDNADVAAPPFAAVSFPLDLLWPFDPAPAAQV